MALRAAPADYAGRAAPVPRLRQRGSLCRYAAAARRRAAGGLDSGDCRRPRLASVARAVGSVSRAAGRASVNPPSPPAPPRWQPSPLLRASVTLHAGAAVLTVLRPHVWPWTLGAVIADQQIGRA